MSTRTCARILGVLMALAMLSACSGSGKKSAASPGLPSANSSTLRLPKCRYPPRIATPTWIPPDLPLPQGTYATQSLAATFGYERAVLVVPGSAESFARFVIKEWPKSGWVLGRGDAEPGEVEDQFLRPPAVGAFRARTEFCNPGYSLMLIIYTRNRQAIPLPSSSPGGSPIAPSASPSASPSK